MGKVITLISLSIVFSIIGIMSICYSSNANNSKILEYQKKINTTQDSFNQLKHKFDSLTRKLDNKYQFNDIEIK